MKRGRACWRVSLCPSSGLGTTTKVNSSTSYKTSSSSSSYATQTTTPPHLQFISPSLPPSLSSATRLCFNTNGNVYRHYYSTQSSSDNDELKQLIERLKGEKKGKANKPFPLAQDLTRVTSALDHTTTDISLLDQLVDALVDKPQALKATRVDKILDSYQKSNQWKKALDFADSIRATEGFVPDNDLFLHMAKLYAKHGRLVTTSRVLSDMIIEGCPPLPVKDATEIVREAKSLEDMVLLRKLWKLYEDNQIFGDLDFYNELMQAALRAGNPSKAIYWFGQVEHTTRTVRWNSTTYSIIMQALGRVDRVDLVKRWLARVQNRGHSLDVTILNGHINGLAAGGEYEQAYNKLKEIERTQRPAPNKDTYSAYIDGCCFQGAIEHAWRGIRRMKAKGFQPTVDDYNAIIKGCIKGEKFREIDEALTRMTDDNIAANVSTFNLVLQVCVAQKEVLKAEQIFAALQKQGLVPDSDTYHYLIETCVAYEQALQEGDPYNPALPGDAKKLVAKAQGYLDEMWQKGLLPSGKTMHMLLKFIIKAKELDKARECYDRISSFGFPLTPEIVTLMSHATYDTMVAKRLI